MGFFWNLPIWLNNCLSKRLWHILCFFILRLWLQPTAKGRSLSGPNIWLRPKVKIGPTVQHWKYQTQKSHKICTHCRVSEAKIYLYHNAKIAKARPQYVVWPEYYSVQKQWFFLRYSYYLSPIYHLLSNYVYHILRMQLL